MKKINLILLVISSISLLLAACGGNPEVIEKNALSASGNISAEDLGIASEIGGKVLRLNVREGDWVEEGEVLFILDDELIQAQYDQTNAAVEVAKATVGAAQAQLDSAQLQYDIVLQSARIQDLDARSRAWEVPQLPEIELPNWYFLKGEKIEAVEAEVEAAESGLAIANADLADVLANVSNDDFLSAEKRLALSQTTFINAAYALQQTRLALDSEALEEVAQEDYDAALADLETAQLEYDRFLTSADAEEVLEIRAKVALAQTRLDHAQDIFLSFQTGDDSLQVQAAQAGVTQAETALVQAEAGLVQAKAALEIFEIQLGKAEVIAPDSGVVLSLNIGEGELIAPGAIVMTVGKLDEVTLTVYIPEDEYGRVSLGQEAIVTVDSFPNKTFSGTVTYIADEAEFTPRNVQTAEGRKNTVFAIKIVLENRNLELKPGMPADVTIYFN
jgi:multidrug resistance efflux pump